MSGVGDNSFTQSDVRGGRDAIGGLRPTRFTTGTIVATTLDQGEMPRMLALGYFGAVTTPVSFTMSLFVAAEPWAKWLLWSSNLILFVGSIALIYAARDERLYRTVPMSVLWIVSAVAQGPSFIYYSPFSAVVALPMLTLFISGLSYRRTISTFFCCICVGIHMSIAAPYLFRWIPDRGTMHPPLDSKINLFATELLAVIFFVASFMFGRWVRHTNMQAAAELERATRAIAMRDAVLGEARQELERAAWLGGPGRYTDQHLGNYRLGSVIGRGGMGEVYEAESLTNGSSAAIKILHRNVVTDVDHMARFTREARVAQSISSPHVVKIFDVSPPESPTPFIVMERLQGHDLAHHLRTEHRFSIANTVQLIAQIAAGLEAARNARVVHRDLKPQNLYRHVSADVATWKILDFGLSKFADQHGTLTQGQVVGTPTFMAPEQARGDVVDHRADVYALGAVLYRTLTGFPAFTGDDVFAVLTDVLTRMPVRPGELVSLSTDVDSVIALALAKAPSTRFKTALELSDAFVRASVGGLTHIERERANEVLSEFPWRALRT